MSFKTSRRSDLQEFLSSITCQDKSMYLLKAEEHQEIVRAEINAHKVVKFQKLPPKKSELRYKKKCKSNFKKLISTGHKLKVLSSFSDLSNIKF